MSHNIQHINGDQFESVVLQSDIPVIIDFYSDDCAPCDVLAPIFEKMAEKYDGHIKFIKIFGRRTANSPRASMSPAARRSCFTKTAKRSARACPAS